MYICIHCIHDETSPVIKTTAFGFVFIHRVWLERTCPVGTAGSFAGSTSHCARSAGLATASGSCSTICRFSYVPGP